MPESTGIRARTEAGRRFGVSLYVAVCMNRAILRLPVLSRCTTLRRGLAVSSSFVGSHILRILYFATMPVLSASKYFVPGTYVYTYPVLDYASGIHTRDIIPRKHVARVYEYKFREQSNHQQKSPTHTTRMGIPFWLEYRTHACIQKDAIRHFLRNCIYSHRPTRFPFIPSVSALVPR